MFAYYRSSEEYKNKLFDLILCYLPSKGFYPKKVEFLTVFLFVKLHKRFLKHKS